MVKGTSGSEVVGSKRLYEKPHQGHSMRAGDPGIAFSGYFLRTFLPESTQARVDQWVCMKGGISSPRTHFGRSFVP